MASGSKTTINRTRCKVRLINFNDHINEGYVFLAYGQRLSDLLNDDRDFLPLETDAGEVRVFSKRSIMEVEVLDHATPGKAASPSSDVVQLISGNAFDILGVTHDANDAAIRLRYLELKESVQFETVNKITANKDLVAAACAASQPLRSRLRFHYQYAENGGDCASNAGQPAKTAPVWRRMNLRQYQLCDK